MAYCLLGYRRTYFLEKVGENSERFFFRKRWGEQAKKGVVWLSHARNGERFFLLFLYLIVSSLNESKGGYLT